MYRRDQVTKYCLFLVARVGSTYLTSLLESHSDVLARGEELRDLQAKGADAQLAFARDFYTPPLLGRHKAVGFNVKLVHTVDPTSFATILVEKQVKIIHLVRRNRVKAVVSRMNGSRLYKETGMWGLYDESKRPDSFAVDLDEFDELLKHRESVDNELEAYVNQLPLPTLKIYYEDLLRNEQAFLDSIFEFLEVPAKTVEGQTLKITSDDLSKVLENFAEVRAQYVGTEYEAMFDEVINP